jgi:hypothetical protein
MGNYVQPDYRVPVTDPKVTVGVGYNRNALGIGAPTTPYIQPGTSVPASSQVGVQVENVRNPLNITGPQAPHVEVGTAAPVTQATIQLVNKNPLNVTGPQTPYVQPGTSAPPKPVAGQLSDVLGR